MYYACTMHRVFLTAVNSLEVALLFVLITFCPSAYHFWLWPISYSVSLLLLVFFIIKEKEKEEEKKKKKKRKNKQIKNPEHFVCSLNGGDIYLKGMHFFSFLFLTCLIKLEAICACFCCSLLVLSPPPFLQAFNSQR